MRPFQLLLVTLCSAFAAAGCADADSSAAVADPTTSPGPAVSPPEAAALPCDASVTTSLPGISVRVKNARCDFTLAEAAAGISVAYEVIVAQDLPTLYTQHVTGERQTKLDLFSTLEGQGQKYCLCDTGPGVRATSELVIPAGTYPGTFAWDGKNFGGPSDTGKTKGPAFPVGAYVLRLHGDGSQTKPAEGAQLTEDYAIDITIPIKLVD